MRVIITGGAGFIGAHVVRRFLVNYPEYDIFNLDALTYAGNLENLRDVENLPNYNFIKGDITDEEFIYSLFRKHTFDSVIHLAAESHVDRSITDPNAFVRTNVMGTVNLLNAAKETWIDDYADKFFYHVSTDEVYGTLGETGLFTESTSYKPNSPYSASKASSDHFVRAYGETYGLPFIISNCSNNYGGYQFPEKLIPLVTLNALEGKPLPIYGTGEQIRDWLHVDDHARALRLVLEKGMTGQTYNIGGHNEKTNLEVVKTICSLLDKLVPESPHIPHEKLITYVTDRPGHDVRYAIDADKIAKDLGWLPEETFESGIEKTINWYLQNSEWCQHVQDGSYQRERLGSGDINK